MPSIQHHQNGDPEWNTEAKNGHTLDYVEGTDRITFKESLSEPRNIAKEGPKREGTEESHSEEHGITALKSKEMEYEKLPFKDQDELSSQVQCPHLGYETIDKFPVQSCETSPDIEKQIESQERSLKDSGQIMDRSILSKPVSENTNPSKSLGDSPKDHEQDTKFRDAFSNRKDSVYVRALKDQKLLPTHSLDRLKQSSKANRGNLSRNETVKVGCVASGPNFNPDSGVRHRCHYLGLDDLPEKHDESFRSTPVHSAFLGRNHSTTFKNDMDNKGSSIRKSPEIVRKKMRSSVRRKTLETDDHGKLWQGKIASKRLSLPPFRSGKASNSRNMQKNRSGTGVSVEEERKFLMHPNEGKSSSELPDQNSGSGAKSQSLGLKSSANSSGHLFRVQETPNLEQELKTIKDILGRSNPSTYLFLCSQYHTAT